MKVVERTF